MKKVLLITVAMVLTSATIVLAEGGNGVNAGASSGSVSDSGASANNFDQSINNYEGSTGLPSTTANPCVAGVAVGVPGTGGVGLNVPLRSCRIFEETILMRELMGDDYARSHLQKIPRVKETVREVNQRRAQAAQPQRAPVQQVASTTSSRVLTPIVLRLPTGNIRLSDQASIQAYNSCKILRISDQRIRKPGC